MKQIRKTIAVIGEGITEQYYILSLKDTLTYNLEPVLPKRSTLKDIEKRIESCIEKGYTKVYCLIDMDNKQKGKAKTDYINLKLKYHNKKKKNPFGIFTTIIFIENNPCTEIWFYYYFKATAGQFKSYDAIPPQVKPRLIKYAPEYNKTEEFFKSCGGLHQYFEKKGGALSKACSNAKLSLACITKDSAYSQMCNLIKETKRK